MNNSKVNNAVDFFNSGFNCSQSVLSVYCEEFGLDKDTALKLACGLGAGMGRLQETCGAVTGAYLVIGMKYGNNNHDNKAAKEQTYALVQEFALRFEERNKTTKCSDLLGVDLQGDDKSFASKRVHEICPGLVKDAVEILESVLTSK